MRIRMKMAGAKMSLSARRAWIEIMMPLLQSVLSLSLSARRAWIEIAKVAALDRTADRRSPQGERG